MNFFSTKTKSVLVLLATTLSMSLLPSESFGLGAAPIPGGGNPSPANRYSEGYSLGQRNGGLIAQRIYDRTIKAGGCSQLDAYQQALLKVNRTVKAPNLNADTDVELVRGFFKGYLDSVRLAIESSRRGCKKVKYDSGAFPGQFYGSLICQAVTVNLDLVHTLEIIPLYDGWSGGSTNRSRECEASARVEVKTCVSTGQVLPSVVVAGVRSACRI